MSTQWSNVDPTGGVDDAEVASMLDENPARGGVDDPQIWLDRFVAEAHELAQQSRNAQAAMADQHIRVENKFMRLTMGAGGQITELVFLASANAATAALLTESFQELHTRAAAKATRATLDIMATMAGPDDPAINAIRDSVSPEVREQMAYDEAHPDEQPHTEESDDNPGPDAGEQDEY